MYTPIGGGGGGGCRRCARAAARAHRTHARPSPAPPPPLPPGPAHTPRAPTDAAIHAKKASVTPEQLFLGFPPSLPVLLRYTRAIGFADAPDYGEVRRLLRAAAREAGVALDGAMDYQLRGSPPSPRYPPCLLPPTSGGVATAAGGVTSGTATASGGGGAPTPFAPPSPATEAPAAAKKPQPPCEPALGGAGAGPGSGPRSAFGFLWGS